MTSKRFDIIYADPPWQYKDKCTSGNRGAGYKYPCASLDDLKALPVANMANNNAVLFMWATWPQLPEALELIEAWGFSYKTCAFVWIKRNQRYWENLTSKVRKLMRSITSPRDIQLDVVKNVIQDKEFLMGMGAAGTRANTEVCILAKRRGYSRLSSAVRQIVETDEPESWFLPHSGRHSEKPAEIRDRIVELFGDVPRVELFCRHQPEGWDNWGNEPEISYSVDMDDYLPETAA